MLKKDLPYITNCKKSRNPEKDWGIESVKAAGYPFDEPPEFYEEYDLRTNCPWWQVGDQGETGACVGFAVADSVLRWHFIKANRLAPNECLSVRYLWMASKETDEFSDRPTTFIECRGTSIKAALAIAYKYGVVLEDEMPFGSGKLYDDDESKFYAIAAKRRITSYFNLGTDVSNWRRWIYNHGPIATRLDLDQSWINLALSETEDTATTLNRKLGRLDVYGEPFPECGHACALVGYTKDRFIVRNSWGLDWGDNGYAYATDDYAKKAFTEVYGVVVEGFPA